MSRGRGWAGRFSAYIPSGKGRGKGPRLRCECSGPSAKWAEFVDKPLKEAFDRAFDTAEREVLATWAELQDSRWRAQEPGHSPPRPAPTGVTSRSARRRLRPGRAALAAHESAGVVIRPYLDPVESAWGNSWATRCITRHVWRYRAFVVSARPMPDEGWPATSKVVADPRRGRGPSRPQEVRVMVVSRGTALPYPGASGAESRRRRPHPPRPPTG